MLALRIEKVLGPAKREIGKEGRARISIGSPAAFKRGKALFNGGKPLLEFGGGIAAENALAQRRLAETVNTLLEFFVISVKLVV